MSKVYVLVDERLMAAKNAKRSRHPRHFVVAAYSTMKKAQEAADGYLEALSFAPQGQGWKQGKLKGEITKTESSGKKSDKYGVLHATYRDDEAVLGHLRILTLTVNQPPEDEIDYMTAENFGSLSDKKTLIFVDLSGSVSQMVAPNKSLLSTWKDAMLQSMRRSAGHGTYTIVGLGYPRGGKIITMDSPSGVVQEILRDDSKWQTMGGTEPLTQELVKKYSDKMGGHTDLIYYTDALEYDGYGLAAETFGADEVAYAVMWEGKEDDNEGLIYGIEYMDGEEVSDVEWFATAKERDAELKSYIEEFGAESKFDKLAKEIAADYRKKGKSPEEALEIGEATAAKIGRAKFGKKKFARMGKKAENFYGAEQKGTTASGHKVEYDDGSFYMEFAEPIQGYDSVGGSWYGGDNELPDDIDLQVYHANEDYDNFEISISDVEYYGVSQNKRNRWRLDNDSRGNGPDIFVDMSDELVEAIEEGLNWMLGDLEDIMGVRYGAESVTNTLLPAFGLAAVGALVYTIFLNGKKE